MFRFCVALIMFVGVIDCATIKDKNHEINVREKRSPNGCGPGFPPPPQYGPPPPPPPPPPAHHHHGYHARAYSESNFETDQENQLNAGQYDLNQGQDNQGLDYHNQGYQSQAYQAQGQTSPGGCDSCAGGKSSAISNANSNVGNAVAVAVAKGK